MPSLPFVLLVDDDEAARYLSLRLLRRLGLQAQVRQASNGLEALQQIQADCQAGRPGSLLVLLDLNMPVMGGFDFLAAYHHLPDACRQDTKVVVLSSSEQPDDVRQAQQLATDFVSKPLTEEVLARLLRQHLGYGAPAA